MLRRISLCETGDGYADAPKTGFLPRKFSSVPDREICPAAAGRRDRDRLKTSWPSRAVSGTGPVPEVRGVGGSGLAEGADGTGGHPAFPRGTLHAQGVLFRPKLPARNLPASREPDEPLASDPHPEPVSSDPEARPGRRPFRRRVSGRPARFPPAGKALPDPPPFPPPKVLPPDGTGHGPLGSCRPGAAFP